jgi:pyruvate dehydrogenase E2 component (dihydrolipoamide acetyltransferase)
MPTEILLPQWGMEMDEGTVVRWLKKEGDPVQEGEPLVEIETAKLTTELESFASGILTRIVVPEGGTVPIRAVLAILTAPGEEVAAPEPSSATSASAGPGAAVSVPATAYAGQVVPAARRLAREHNVALTQVHGSGPNGRILIADVERAIEAAKAAGPQDGVAAPVGQVVPAARRLAREQGVDLTGVRGSGPNGRILIADVERAIRSLQSPPAPTGDSDLSHQPVLIQGIRRTIASRMLNSLQTMAQVTLTTEANVSEAMTLREGLSRHADGPGLSPLHLVVKACARALQDHPRMNAIQTEEGFRLMDRVNVGLAVSLPEGLVTPVLRDADSKSLGKIAAEARDLAAKTRENRATPEDLADGSFTVTNLGVYDIDAFTPIINPPQVGILGVGRAVDKPIIANGEVVKAAMMVLSLTFDHRVVDGAPAAAFLQAVKGYLEDPWWMVS